MTNESCHSEDPDSSGGEESLLLNDEILRPDKIGTQDDKVEILKQACPDEIGIQHDKVETGISMICDKTM